jgi:hypothetical protein
MTDLDWHGPYSALPAGRWTLNRGDPDGSGRCWPIDNAEDPSLRRALPLVSNLSVAWIRDELERSGVPGKAADELARWAFAPGGAPPGRPAGSVLSPPSVGHLETGRWAADLRSSTWRFRALGGIAYATRVREQKRPCLNETLDCPAKH